MTLFSFNPANGTTLRSYNALSAEAVTAKVADAQRAFEQFRETPLELRVMWMKKLAGILEQEMEELATLLTMETGKTIRASREEVLQCAVCCRYFAENAITLLGDETVEVEANLCTTTWHPMGVLFAVMPGVSPLWHVFRVMVPALLGGNAMVSKHVANVPQCAVEVEVLLRRAGFAHGIFQTLLMDFTDVEVVLNDERIIGVAIAGMRQAGREIAAHTAWMGKKALIDREESSAFLVMPSANLFAAIQAGVARCVENGQSNTSTARFFVHESVYDEFAFLFTTAMEDVKIGNPLKDETELGPMPTEESVILLKAQIASAVAAGGSVLTGGEPMLSDGNYFEPTVIVDVPADAWVCREEIHGPVAMLFKVTSLHDAIAVVNRACRNGISVWTQDEGEKQRLSRQLVCGSVFINSPMIMDARTELGNFKGAGYGQAMVAASLHDFMSARTVVTSGSISATEFHFDLTLDEFEKEAQLAEAEEPTKVKSYKPVHPEEAEVEDDLFVMTQAAWNEQVSSFIDVDTALEAFSVPSTDMMPDEPDIKAVVSKPIATDKPITTENPVSITNEVKATVEMTSQAAALSFKEMFERALQVRT